MFGHNARNESLWMPYRFGDVNPVAAAVCLATPAMNRAVGEIRGYCERSPFEEDEAFSTGHRDLEAHCPKVLRPRQSSLSIRRTPGVTRFPVGVERRSWHFNTTSSFLTNSSERCPSEHATSSLPGGVSTTAIALERVLPLETSHRDVRPDACTERVTTKHVVEKVECERRTLVLVIDSSTAGRSD